MGHPFFREEIVMILVTGASGLNGSAVIREFARHKQPVRGLVRNARKSQALKLDCLPEVEIVEGDMLQPATLGPAFRDVDRVLLISSANDRLLETQCTFIDAAKKSGVRHVVKFSGAESGIGFDPTKFRFTRMHEEAERYLECSGLAWTHLRPCQFMEVYLREVPTIVTKGAIFLPLENIALSPVDVEDIAKIAFAVLTSNGHEANRYDITGPEALTMTEIAARISQAIGRTIRYVNISPQERRSMLLAMGTPSEFADALDEQTAERVRHPESKVYLGTHEAFGVRPTTFAEFAKRNAAVLRGESRLDPATTFAGRSTMTVTRT
jgi:uncharacterized protein YbjT (DUF2867 family)